MTSAAFENIRTTTVNGTTLAYCVIPDASHLMHEDNPSEVNKAILELFG